MIAGHEVFCKIGGVLNKPIVLKCVKSHGPQA